MLRRLSGWQVATRQNYIFHRSDWSEGCDRIRYLKHTHKVRCAAQVIIVMYLNMKLSTVVALKT